MDRRHRSRSQSVAPTGRGTHAWVRGLFCLLLAGNAFGATNEADIASRPASELADLSLAQLMELEVPTVVTASKHEQKVTEAPSAVSIVTAEYIKKYGYR